MEETLRAYQRMENRYTKASMGSGKFHQRSKVNADQFPSKSTRAGRAIRVKSESSSSESDPSGSEENVDGCRVCATTVPTRVQSNQDHCMLHEEANRLESRDHGERSNPCTHCGSIKHNDLVYWKRLTFQKCGRKGHPSDKYFYACSACEKVHDSGECPSEKFYNLMRKWYVPTKHAEIFRPRRMRC